MEFLLLNKKSLTEWEVMVRPGKKAKKGARFIFGDELAAEFTARRIKYRRNARWAGYVL